MILKFSAEAAVAPKLTEVAPKVNAEFVLDIVILPLSIPVVIFVPPTISNCSPSDTDKFVESPDPKVIEEFDKEALPIFDSVLFAPEIVLFVRVSVDDSVTIEPSVAKVISFPEIVVFIPEPPVNKIEPPKLIV